MAPDLLDLALGFVVLIYAAAGYRSGFIGTAAALAGFVGGGVLGLAVMPDVVTRLGADDAPPLTRAVLLVGGIVLLAVLAQGLLGLLAGRVSRRVHGHQVGRGVDGVLGALTAGVVTLVLAWGIGSGVRPALPQEWSRTLAASRVLGGVDTVLPVTASDLFTRVRSSGAGEGFPQVFGGLAAEPIAPVAPPDPSVPSTPAIRRAQASVVRVVADAGSCTRVDQGSGWVVAPGKVVTNAHVVAGATAVTVSSGGTGRRRDARVVLLDPALDLAVLDVPGLTVAPLPTAPDLPTRAPAVVAGFPLGGPYTLGSARVRQVLEALGSDIYGTGQVQRRVYSLYGTVRPGNSGGPLLDTQGRVVGTVFARSLDDAGTGYALTNTQTRDAIARGLRATAAVDTGRCTTE